jgi:hypothetical protein
LIENQFQEHFVIDILEFFDYNAKFGLNLLDFYLIERATWHRPGVRDVFGSYSL